MVFSNGTGWPPNGGGRPFSHSAPSFRGIKRPFPFSIATIPGQVPVSCVVESAPVGRHGYNCRLVGKNGRRNSMSCLRHPMSFLFLFDLSSTSETLAHASCFFFFKFFTLLCASAVRIPDTGRDGPSGCEATQGQGVLTCWDLVEWAIYC